MPISISAGWLSYLAAHALIAFTWLLSGQAVHAQGDPNSCGSLVNGYGPYDYRTQRIKLEVVERAHFTPKIEALIQGRLSTLLAQDIAYTLHTSPNHHRALISLVRLGERFKSPQPQGLTRPIECYFDRAIRFTPDDTVVLVLYARFLIKHKRIAEAVHQLEAAILHANDNPLSHYNIGLAFFDSGQYDNALVQAHKALALGLESTELTDLLKAANKWREPAN